MRNSLAALCGALMSLELERRRRGRHPGRLRRGPDGRRLHRPVLLQRRGLHHGNQAVMAWKVTEGAWKGVDLSGLCVAAAVQGTTTFSEDKPEKAGAVLIVDEKADRGPARGPGRDGPASWAGAGSPTSSP